MRAAAVIALLAAALAVCVAVAAGSSKPPQEPDPGIVDGSTQRMLDRARTSWKAARLRSYRYEIEQHCFCPQQKRRVVVVRGAKPTRFPGGLSSVATVPRLFAFIQRAIDARAVKLTATYGARGVPREIYVDRSMYVIDEETGYSIRRFTRIAR